VTELGFPLAGSTLIVGPSQAGKTRLTARALEAWIEEHGSAGVAVVELGPEYEHEGSVLGRRLERYVDIPADVWVGTVDAFAPRAESDGEAERQKLARKNARAAAERLGDAPTDPAAVFVNDTTIGFQHTDSDLEQLFDYCRTADVAVLNAFESDELGTDDSVSVRERRIVERLQTWSDRTVALTGQ
jgi:hypothetical protein